uniref:Cysteine dioxygenase n=1 Tax=Panagrolaimus sp. JU765 TaxID=591449 RepID=A0AC34Q6H6_9BILA
MDNLISKIREIFSHSEVDTDTVKDLLAQYQSNPRDWQEYVTFDPHKYTRNLVDTGNGKYNLIVLCWGPGMSSSIHDHSNSHCFVKMLEGTLLETQYDWPEQEPAEQPLCKLAENYCDKDGVSYIHDNIGLHRMENPSHSNPAISLHLYSPPYDLCRTFDEVKLDY